MKTYIDSIKKDKIKAKNKGEHDEWEYDPIPFSLYCWICDKSINDGDVYTWYYTVLQWNCMDKSVRIDELTFKIITIWKDSIIVQYMDRKCDQKGKKNLQKLLCEYT